MASTWRWPGPGAGAEDGRHDRSVPAEPDQPDAGGPLQCGIVHHVLRMLTDYERIGDHVLNIAQAYAAIEGAPRTGLRRRLHRDRNGI